MYNIINYYMKISFALLMFFLARTEVDRVAEVRISKEFGRKNRDIRYIQILYPPPPSYISY